MKSVSCDIGKTQAFQGLVEKFVEVIPNNITSVSSDKYGNGIAMPEQGILTGADWFFEFRLFTTLNKAFEATDILSRETEPKVIQKPGVSAGLYCPEPDSTFRLFKSPESEPTQNRTSSTTPVITPLVSVLFYTFFARLSLQEAFFFNSSNSYLLLSVQHRYRYRLHGFLFDSVSAYFRLDTIGTKQGNLNWVNWTVHR